MIDAVKERNRIALALLELARDKNFKRIPEKEGVKLAEEVLSIGEEVSAWVSSEYGTSDQRKLAERINVKICGVEKGGMKKSEYRKKEGKIVIFRDILDRLTAEITTPDLLDRILGFLIAHELFHHLEEVKIGHVYKKFKFKGRFNIPFYIKGLSEVAAQAFVRKLLSLQFSPKVFDFMTYILFTSDFKH